MEEFIDTEVSYESCSESSNNINQNWWRSTKIGYSRLIDEDETSEDVDFDAKSKNSAVAENSESSELRSFQFQPHLFTKEDRCQWNNIMLIINKSQLIRIL